MDKFVLNKSIQDFCDRAPVIKYRRVERLLYFGNLNFQNFLGFLSGNGIVKLPVVGLSQFR